MSAARTVLLDVAAFIDHYCDINATALCIDEPAHNLTRGEQVRR